MTKNHQRTLCVSGASGQLGRRVVEILLEDQNDRIVATTRTPEKLADLAEKGVIVRKADFDDPKSLDTAFEGVDRLLLISTDAIDDPGHRIIQHGSAIEGAVRCGVKHIVYTSSPHPEPGSPILFAPDHYDTEQMLAATSLSWTILRNNLYTDSLMGRLAIALATGELIAAAGEGGVAYVTREDCARAAAAALSSTSADRETLDIAGPKVVTFEELAKIGSEISGQPLQYISVEPEDLHKRLLKANIPSNYADLLVSYDLATAQGLLSTKTKAVAELTGKAPESLKDYLTKNLSSLIE